MKKDCATGGARCRESLRCSERLRRREGQSGEEVGIERVCLDSSLERQEGVAGIRHFEDPAKAVLCEVADLEDLQVGGHRAQVELCDDNIIDDDGRLGGFIERGSE